MVGHRPTQGYDHEGSKVLFMQRFIFRHMSYIVSNMTVTVMLMVPTCSIWGACAAIVTQQVGYVLVRGMQALLDDNTFCGLALDEDNQDDLSADRIKLWVAQISEEMKA